MNRVPEDPRGKSVEAVELIERAANLAPANLDLTRELLAAAVKADRYLVAGHAALALGRGGDDLGGLEVVTMDLFYGCRGDRSESEPVSGASPPEADEKLPDNACVDDVDSEPLCEPCTYSEGDDEEEYGDDCGDCGHEGDNPEMSEEEAERRRQIEEAEAAAAAAQEAVEQAERDAQVEKARKEFEVEVADHDLYLTKIDTAYSGGSWVYLEIRNRQAGRIAGAKIQLYRVDKSNENGGTWYDVSTLEVSEVELPPLGPNASVGLWFEASDDAGVEYGVTRLASEEIARERIAKGLEGQSSGDAMPAHHSVVHDENDCSCGGC